MRSFSTPFPLDELVLELEAGGADPLVADGTEAVVGLRVVLVTALVLLFALQLTFFGVSKTFGFFSGVVSFDDDQRVPLWTSVAGRADKDVTILLASEVVISFGVNILGTLPARALVVILPLQPARFLSLKFCF